METEVHDGPVFYNNLYECLVNGMVKGAEFQFPTRRSSIYRRARLAPVQDCLDNSRFGVLTRTAVAVDYCSTVELMHKVFIQTESLIQKILMWIRFENGRL